jgi:ZIP family zinc transporter
MTTGKMWLTGAYQMDASLWEATLAAAVTVLANGLGGVPFLFVRRFPEQVARFGWAISGGLMLSASVFNLIIPGVDDGGIMPVAAGIFLGAAMMVGTSHWLSHREITVAGLSQDGARRVAMVLITLFIHSFPEGLAIGVAYGSGYGTLGLVMAVAIAIHNIPEGLAVSLPLRAEGVGPWKCILWALVSGVPQVIAAIPAFMAVRAFRPILPYAFGFAAGAMIFLVFSEMIPESRDTERQRLSSGVAGMVGFLTMMVIQQVLVF